MEDDEHSASEDVLADIDDRVSSPSSAMLQYTGIRSRRFYHFHGEEVTKVKVLNCHVTELAGLCSWDNLNKMDIVWSSAEAEDKEVGLKSIEAAWWMGWWTFAMKSVSLKFTKDAPLVCHLSRAGVRCQLLVAKTASTL